MLWPNGPRLRGRRRSARLSPTTPRARSRGFADQLETLSDSLGQQILAAAKDPDGLASEATLLDLGERVAFMAEQMQTMGDGRDMALERAGLARSSHGA